MEPSARTHACSHARAQTDARLHASSHALSHALVMAAKNGVVLARLRKLMRGGSGVMNEAIHALIIPSGDAHQSEYIADCDCRRAYVSGFTGSAGLEAL